MTTAWAYAEQTQETPVTIKAGLAVLSISSHHSTMSSNSSRSFALVTGASTKTGSAVALCLAKDFDVVINDLPEALKPLEALKAQIENEGGKCVIIAGDASEESFWASIGSTIEEQLGSDSILCCHSYSSMGETMPFESLYWPHKSAAEQCSKRDPGAEFVGVFTRFGNTSRYAFNLVIADEEGSAVTSLPGATGPLKSAIRGLTEAAATDLSRYGINVNSCYEDQRELVHAFFYNSKKQTHTPFKESAESTKGLTDNLIGKIVYETAIESVETAEDVANVISFLTSKSALSITGNVHSVLDLSIISYLHVYLSHRSYFRLTH
ncbi:hypothetical protein C0992_005907 [Termitomyces sp. T32_za158]|nr:hypothetical protein C0992_005907 [Termitomyces sp. T32_za158]